MAFLPSQAHGVHVRRQMYDRLAESLEHIFEQAAPVVAFDQDRASALVLALRAGDRFAPRLFARYFDVLSSIEDNADQDTIEGALGRLIDERAEPADEVRLIVHEAGSSSERDTAEIVRHFPLDDLDGAAAEALQPADAVAERERFAAALSLMREAAPLTYGELQETVSEIVLARGSLGANGYTFDGASSLQYWGAILVNVAQKKSQLATCEMIAHEAAHNVLFGMAPRTFFVTNAETERYVSPLREDPRPLDGIFHATFVLARMHHVVAEMLASGLPSGEQRDEAAGLLARSARNFQDGRTVLLDHARFTEEGTLILADAGAYMDAAAAGRAGSGAGSSTVVT